MDPIDRDLAIRTVLAEANGQGDDGMAAVAHVIKNRMTTGKYGGRSAAEVVTARNQFEPWNDVGAGKANDPMAYSASDPAYQKAAKIVDGVFSGVLRDNTRGATHFYAPKAQAALGRKSPSWAAGQQGLKIGDHMFYAPDGSVSDLSQGMGEISQTPGSPEPKMAAAAPLALGGGGAAAGGGAPAGGGLPTAADLLRMFMGRMGGSQPATPTHGALNTLLFGQNGWQGHLNKAMPNGILGSLFGGGAGGGASPAPAAPSPGAGQPMQLAPPAMPAAPPPMQMQPPGGAGPGPMVAGGGPAPEGPPAMPNMPPMQMAGAGAAGANPMDLLRSLFGGMGGA